MKVNRCGGNVRFRVGGLFACLAGAFCLFLSLSTDAAWAKPRVETVRIDTYKSRTSIVIMTDEGFKPRVFTLSDPARVVIDMPEVKWAIPVTTGPVDNELIDRFRYGINKPGKSRLVLDLSEAAKVLDKRTIAARGDGLAMVRIDIAPVAEPVEAEAPEEEAEVAVADLPQQGLALRPFPLPSGVFPPQVFPPAQPAEPAGPRDEEQVLAMLERAPLPPRRPPLPRERTAEEALTEAGFDVAELRALLARVPALPRVEPVVAPPVIEPVARPPSRIERPAAVPDRPVRKHLIVLDPGHGGKDPGAVNKDHDLHEKEVVLKFARILRDALHKTGRYEVRLTRDGDSFIKLTDRVEAARVIDADLFISIHADWLEQRSVAGATAYLLSHEESDEQVDDLTERRGAVGKVAGADIGEQPADVARVLIELARRNTHAQSKRFAKLLMDEMQRVSPVLKRPVRPANYVVLKAPDTPSVLLELGFMSNNKDVKRLTSTKWHKKAAKAVVAAVDRWAQEGESEDGASE